MTGRLRVAICDDDPVFRRLLRRVLHNHAEVVGDVGTGDEALTLLEDTRPDVLLLDVQLGDESVLGLLPPLLRAGPTTMIAALTGLDAASWEREVLVAGAFVYYEKTHVLDLPTLLTEDVALFQRALAGEDVLAPSALGRRPTTRSAHVRGGTPS